MDSMKDGIDPEKTLEAIWCVNSETGKKHLIDLKTGKILGEEITNEKSNVHSDADSDGCHS